MTKAVGIIPVRLESTRLPRKALTPIEGLPMIVHTLKRAQLSKELSAVYIATDSEEIKKVIERANGKVIMTSSSHHTGSDRIAEAAQKVNADIIVNIQGDEPLLNPSHVDEVAKKMIERRNISVAVLVVPYTQKGRTSDIKAVLDLQNNILYCSRNDLPSDVRKPVNVMWRMSFVVGFHKKFLLKYASWEQTPLEKIEYNEYLRILEHGYKIRAIPVDHAEISVDTPEDLEIVSELMKRDPLKRKYSDLFCESKHG